jgi:hypothetical protein
MKTFRAGLIILAAVAAMNINSVRADQPHMREALHHLRLARAELAQAERNKGGHREHALENVDRAIAQVEAGMRLAR